MICRKKESKAKAQFGAFSFLVGQHLKDLKDPIMEGVLVETENMLAHGRMDLPLSLCFATLKGDDLLLHQLLKRGLDPTESNNSGRSALHISSSNGSESCVLLLLDYGEVPNITGLSESNCSLSSYLKGSVLMDERSDDFLPEVSRSSSPQRFLPLPAPSTLTPFTTTITIPKLSGLCSLNFYAGESMMSMPSILTLPRMVTDDCLTVMLTKGVMWFP